MCNCALFIKSGDDVIKISRCTTETPTGRRNGGFFGGLFGGGRGNQNNNPMEVFLYQNGDLTPNTKLYELDNGNTYEVNTEDCITLFIYIYIH